MLEIKNLSIEVNDKYIVKNLNLVVTEGSKLAIIGEEGNGKSTLLKVIAQVCDYATTTGAIKYGDNRISYMEQVLDIRSNNKKVFDYIFADWEDYYAKITDFYKFIGEMDFDEDLLSQKIFTLSGGEKIKMMILKILLDQGDVILLDEPTNDLDIETLKWLENFIVKCSKPVIYVSHDEELLSNTANMILHLEQLNDKTDCQYTLEKCGYDEYVNFRMRKLNHLKQVANNEKREFTRAQEKLKQVMNKVEYQQNTISRKDPHGARLLKKKMHSLKSQEKRLQNMELTEVPDVEEAIAFYFNEVKLPSMKFVLNLEIPVLKVDNKILAKNIKLNVMRDEHVGIIGKNGAGKSSLIKIIYDELSQREGINLGYMPQNYEDILNNYEYVLDFITDKNKENITKARTLLGSLNFTPSEVVGKIEDLSNGTKAKLILASLVLRECNCLLLDEPTRNVSPLSNPVIRGVLKNFKGPIISVSHDRKYLNEVVDRIYKLSDKGLEEVNME